MNLSLGKAVGFVVGAVLTFAVGYAIVSRIPPLWMLIQPKQSQ